MRALHLCPLHVTSLALQYAACSRNSCLLVRTLYILSISQQQGCLYKEKKNKALVFSYLNISCLRTDFCSDLTKCFPDTWVPARPVKGTRGMDPAAPAGRTKLGWASVEAGSLPGLCPSPGCSPGNCYSWRNGA